MVFDRHGVTFYIGLLSSNLEVQSIICNLIFPKEMYFKSVVACHFPSLFTNMTHSGIDAKEIVQKREKQPKFHYCIFIPTLDIRLNVDMIISNGLLHFTFTFTDKRLVYRNLTQLLINTISQLETESVKKPSF